MMNQSQTQTAIRGTKGYVAPEWFLNLPITTKVDVYSFGVVLLEVICCRRSVDMENFSEERAILTDWFMTATSKESGIRLLTTKWRPCMRKQSWKGLSWLLFGAFKKTLFFDPL
ncbi:putative protein kinase RLK-Pelle-SD-2b family [Rosa chinensis]|uniref:Protein kinase domain-containing protein n=3 Tax=Rosa chinensis TaxID=74649 RepID=A0A2P6QMD2_ROSCH|nr:putative protein kinase RLK-Pelle-SD-2b family [Rosa chinensis]